ncbi:MAG: hypothetical protein MZW92_23915 [Comamonadaceae bacterium]|nr:hypothetical protein [Comamonadaceae bacterium]
MVTHITIAAVTIFLHRAQAHRALELHRGPVALLPLLAVADHRHGDQGVGRDPPQAPRQVRDRGRPAQPGRRAASRRVLLTGRELYRAEAKVQETLDKYGHHTPDDWIERNLYSRYSWQGVGLMLIVDLLLFGAIGADGVGGADGRGSRSPRPASSTASATGGATATSRRPTPRPTSRPGASSSAARSCTTTTTPTRPRPSCRSSPTSSTSAGPTSARWRCWAWPRCARRRRSWRSAPSSRWPTARRWRRSSPTATR